MSINTLYKRRDGQTLVITGHFNKAELKDYQKQGYKFRNPDLNKHGIRVVRY